MINIFQPSLGEEEIKALRKLFKTNWLGRGPIEKKFVDTISKKLKISSSSEGGYSFVQSKNLTTLNCCTEGLFQSMSLIGIGPGDEVILPSLSFVGAANAVIDCGATPVFCDVEVDTFNTTAKHIEPLITRNTKAVILLHYGGVPCDIYPIIELCKKHNIRVIEDNANSPFSSHKGRSTGTIGDYGIWSFDSMKMLVMGDGALFYAKNEDDIDKLKSLSYLGMTSKSGFDNVSSETWWEFEVNCAGRRSIINDINATLGMVQLEKIDGFISRRKLIHDLYCEELSDIENLYLPKPINSYDVSSYYLFHVRTPYRNKFAKYLRDNGIYVTLKYHPLHKVSFYKNNTIDKLWNKNLPNTDLIGDTAICLPLHQGLTDDEINKTIKLIKTFFNERIFQK